MNIQVAQFLCKRQIAIYISLRKTMPNTSNVNLCEMLRKYVKSIGYEADFILLRLMKNYIQRFGKVHVNEVKHLVMQTVFVPHTFYG